MRWRTSSGSSPSIAASSRAISRCSPRTARLRPIATPHGLQRHARGRAHSCRRRLVGSHRAPRLRHAPADLDGPPHQEPGVLRRADPDRPLRPGPGRGPQGHDQPLAVDFPGGLARHRGAPLFRLALDPDLQPAHRARIATVLEHLPPDRPLRVLEIGAGTGGLTSYLLPRLPARPHRVRVHRPLEPLLHQGRAEVRGLSVHQVQEAGHREGPVRAGVRRLTPSTSSWPPRSCTPRPTCVRRSATSASCSLADGLLVLLEVVKPAALDRPGLRSDRGLVAVLRYRPPTEYPLLTFPGWERLLGGLGFSETVDIASAAKAEGFGSAVIFSRGPASSEDTPPRLEGPRPRPAARPSRRPSRRRSGGTQATRRRGWPLADLRRQGWRRRTDRRAARGQGRAPGPGLRDDRAACAGQRPPALGSEFAGGHDAVPDGPQGRRAGANQGCHPPLEPGHRSTG